jgi:hypothetical protein
MATAATGQVAGPLVRCGVVGVSSESETGGSWLPRSNSVNPSTGGNQAYEQTVVENAEECVAEFRGKYPKLSRMPVSETPGRELRSALVEAEYVEEWIEPESEFEQGHTVKRLDRAESVTMAEALFVFLVERQPYDDGIGGKFQDRETGEEFTKEFHDCWTVEYGEEQAGRNAGAQRQLMGGVYPEREESERSGEYECGVWSDDVATVMLTRTGSSMPGSSRVPPVDFADAVTRTWSQGSDNVYNVVRNICEKELGLGSDEWGYVRGDDVHGLDDDSRGVNACYPHCHDAIYLDVAATDLRERFGSDGEVEAELESVFYKAVEKHMELCEYARPEGHQRGEAVEARLDLEKPGAYATEYLRLNAGEMMEAPVEFQVFAAVEWATNRQRIARSQIFTEAAKADMCKQDSERDHGDRLTYDRSGHGEAELVCAECGSGVGIEGETMAEERLSEPSESGGSERAIGACVGESTGSAEARSEVEEYVARVGEPESVVSVMGELGMSPEYRETVEDVLGGEESVVEAEPVMGEAKEPPRYELEAVVMPDGGEEPVSAPGGGGVDMTALVLPEERLLRETRLQHQGDVASPKIVVEDGGDRLATYNPEVAAGWLVDHGYRRPWHAELALSFVVHGGELPVEFEEPESEPPTG